MCESQNYLAVNSKLAVRSDKKVKITGLGKRGPLTHLNEQIDLK